MADTISIGDVVEVLWMKPANQGSFWRPATVTSTSPVSVSVAYADGQRHECERKYVRRARPTNPADASAEGGRS